MTLWSSPYLLHVYRHTYACTELRTYTDTSQHAGILLNTYVCTYCTMECTDSLWLALV